MSNATEVPLNETTITAAGVMRCCLATVAVEYAGLPVSEGMESRCAHCATLFRLVQRDGRLFWLPLWQIDQQEMQRERSAS